MINLVISVILCILFIVYGNIYKIRADSFSTNVNSGVCFLKFVGFTGLK